ncbi:MAG: aminotransferase class V-fold PLP-dependent enzyme, partial [Bacteroidota bacterium]
GKMWNEQILDAIDTATKMVTLGHIHWADGTIFDLKAIRKRTKEVGALLVVDGTQSIGALPFSVKNFEPDALIVAGYKCMMGPYSIGCAYFGPYFDEGLPLEENWKNRKDSHIFSRLVDYQPEYQPGALRYDVGESSNFILVPMLLEAIRQVNAWEPWKIQVYCKHITAAPLEALTQMGWEVEGSDQRASHLFGIRPPMGLDLLALKAQLEKEKIFVSVRGDAIRVSPSVYNTEEDLYRLVEACKKVGAKERVS